MKSVLICKMEIMQGCWDNSMIRCIHTLRRVNGTVDMLNIRGSYYCYYYYYSFKHHGQLICDLENSGENKLNMVTFTVIDNKTRLDFGILLILCSHPDQMHLVVCSKCAKGHTWPGRSKKELLRRCSVNHSWMTNASQKEVGSKSPVASVSFETYASLSHLP